MPVYYDDPIYYDQPGYFYNGLNPSQSLQIGAFIVKGNSLYIRGDIQKKGRKFLQIGCRISQIKEVTISIGGKITLASYLSLRGSILNSVDQQILIRGSITNTVHRNIKLQARIAHLSTISIRASILNTVDQGINIRGRIMQHVSRTIGIKAHLKTTWQTLSLRASISFGIGIRARMSQRQGWPIPLPSVLGDNNFRIFQPTQLQIRASILPPILSQQSISIKGRINWLRTKNLEIGARIVTGKTISIGARITPRFYASTLPVAYSISTTYQNKIRMVFSSNENGLKQTLAVGAFISKPKKVRFTGHFIVTNPGGFESPQKVLYSSTVAPRSTLGIKARIG